MIENFKEYNSQFNFSHINDSYFIEKLEKGLVKYEPKLWEIAQLEPMDERKLK